MKEIIFRCHIYIFLLFCDYTLIYFYFIIKALRYFKSKLIILKSLFHATLHFDTIKIKSKKKISKKIKK